MIEDDDLELEFSSLNGKVSRDGLTVEVFIYRGKDSDEGWILEVEDWEQGSTVWENKFSTDKEAYAEFHRVLENRGIEAFVDDSVPDSH